MVFVVSVVVAGLRQAVAIWQPQNDETESDLFTTGLRYERTKSAWPKNACTSLRGCSERCDVSRTSKKNEPQITQISQIDSDAGSCGVRSTGHSPLRKPPRAR